ncbi:isoprenoid synthase domain-containing protein [Aspergillus fruticulosus]
METVTAHLQHCEQVHPKSYDPPPTDHFCTYPLFSSKAAAVSLKVSEEFTASWKRACQVDRLHEQGLDFHACATHLGHYIQWAYADCIPERVELLAEHCDLAFFWDDVTDAISADQNAEITKDFAIAILSKLQSGKYIEPKLEINKLGIKNVSDVIDLDHQTGMGMVQSWKAHLDAQAKSTHNNLSFEQYIKHRFSEVGAMWAVELGCWANDIHITKEEKASVQYLVQIILTGGMLGNDYYSFNKEFDEHKRANTLDRMQNALSLLMSEYGYTEEEARGILRNEIQRREREFMDEFDVWTKSAGPQPTELHRYLVMVLIVVSGTMFWMSHAARYHRTDLTSTAEDRATLVGKPHGALRVLDGYPAPKGLEGILHKPLAEANGVTNQTHGVANQTNEATNGTNGIINGTNGVTNGTNGYHVRNGQLAMASYTAPFQRAPSDVCDAPYDYIDSLPSKNNRNKFMDALNLWLRVPPSSFQRIKNIVHMLHNSSLMLDDIEDISYLRRGQPATHAFYGISQTINSANLVYVKTVHEVTRLHNPKCMEIFIDELVNLHRGQSLDLYWRHHARCPTTDEYVMMVDNKTGGLFRLMLRLMDAESPISVPLDTSLTTLLTLTGRYYQIRDDYLNLTSADYNSKKGFCEDFDEGKFSILLIHLLNHTPYPDRITSVIYNRPAGTKLQREVKSYILDAMETARTFEYTRGVLKLLHEELMRTLDEVESKLGANDSARLLLLGLGLGLSA